MSFQKATLLLLCICLCIFLSAQSRYKISTKIKVEGDGGWDYLVADEINNRLFVSHATVVQVIDTKSNTLIKTIPDTKGVHGITLAFDLNKGYISNGKDSSVTVFDLKTLKTISKIQTTGVNPDAILYDVFSHKVFVFNGKSNNTTVIDAATDLIVATIALEGKPEFSATDLAGKIYVNIEDKNLVTVINANTLKVEQSWPIVGGEEPTGLAIDNKTHRLFIACSNKVLVVMDATNGKVIAKLPIGEGCDGVAFDAELNRIYASNGEGTMTVMREESENVFKVSGLFTTQRGARTICVNSKTHHIYLPSAEYEEVPVGSKARPKAKPGSFTVLDIEQVIK